MDWFQIGKGVHLGCILLPCLFNLYEEYIMRNARLYEAQAEISIPGRNTSNLRYADDTTLIAESEEGPKSLLMKVKEDSEKAGLQLSIQKMKIMLSCPITSCQIDRETMKTVTDFIFLGSKITAVGDCSHKVKRCLLLGIKAKTSLGRILKSKDICLLTKVYIELDLKEDWVLQNWCFWLAVLEKTLESPLYNKELKPVNPDYSLGGLTLKLKLQYVGHWCEELTH